MARGEVPDRVEPAIRLSRIALQKPEWRNQRHSGGRCVRRLIEDDGAADR